MALAGAITEGVHLTALAGELVVIIFADPLALATTGGVSLLSVSLLGEERCEVDEESGWSPLSIPLSCCSKLLLDLSEPNCAALGLDGAGAAVGAEVADTGLESLVLGPGFFASVAAFDCCC